MRLPQGEEPLDAATVRRRTVTGLWQIALRLLITRGIGMVGVVYISRQLGPSQIGIVALAASVQTVGHVIADAGLGAGLIKRETAPRRRELAVVFGIQLAATFAFAIAATSVAVIVDSEIATAVAIAMWSLPTYVLRSVPSIIADRRLDFRPSAVSDVAESAAYTGASVAAVALGFGARGVVTGTVIAAAIGSVIFLVLVPDGLVGPRLAVREIRGILGYSMRVQLAQALQIGRAQLMGIGTLSIGGLKVLGYVGVGERLLQFPLLAMTPVARVAFPTLARVSGSQKEIGRKAARATRTLTGMVGVVAVPLVAALPPGIVAVFGRLWAPATGLVAAQVLALVVATPSTYVMANLLFARDEAAAALRVQAIAVALTVTAGLGLLAAVGPTGLGAGLLVTAVVELAAYDRVLRRTTGVSLAAAVTPVLLLASCVAAAGLAVSVVLPPSLLVTAGAALAALLIYGAGIVLVFADIPAAAMSWAPGRIRNSGPGRLIGRLR